VTTTARLIVSALSLASLVTFASLAVGGCSILYPPLPYPPTAEPAPTADPVDPPPAASLDAGAGPANLAAAQAPDSSSK
jgi:hypothetical protein